MMLSYVGDFEGVRIYESPWLGIGSRSSGLALPGYGIIIGQNAYSRCSNTFLLEHEYGHFLQFGLIGWWRFYCIVGLQSLLSAWTNGFGRGHQRFWTELWANELAAAHFNSISWPDQRLPRRDINSWTRWWLGIQ